MFEEKEQKKLQRRLHPVGTDMMCTNG